MAKRQCLQPLGSNSSSSSRLLDGGANPHQAQPPELGGATANPHIVAASRLATLIHAIARLPHRLHQLDRRRSSGEPKEQYPPVIPRLVQSQRAWAVLLKRNISESVKRKREKTRLNGDGLGCGGVWMRARCGPLVPAPVSSPYVLTHSVLKRNDYTQASGKKWNKVQQTTSRHV